MQDLSDASSLAVPKQSKKALEKTKSLHRDKMELRKRFQK